MAAQGVLYFQSALGLLKHVLMDGSLTQLSPAGHFKLHIKGRAPLLNIPPLFNTSNMKAHKICTIKTFLPPPFNACLIRSSLIKRDLSKSDITPFSLSLTLCLAGFSFDTHLYMSLKSRQLNGLMQEHSMSMSCIESHQPYLGHDIIEILCFKICFAQLPVPTFIDQLNNMVEVCKKSMQQINGGGQTSSDRPVLWSSGPA